MRGWLFTEAFIEPKLIEKEDPKAIPGEVVIDIKACGLCHSDVGFLESQEMADAYVKAAPCIFGHECAGIISEVGEGVTSLKVGDRVGVVPQSPKNPYEIIGCTRDGGYATKMALIAGCEVYVSTRKAEAQEMARKLGVTGVVSNFPPFISFILWMQTTIITTISAAGISPSSSFTILLSVDAHMMPKNSA